MLTFGPPPCEAYVLHAQSEVQQHSHEGHSGIQCSRENVVVALPPLLPIPEDEEVEYGPDNNPGVVVQGGGWRHVGCSTQEDWEVDQRDPCLARECPVKEPHDEWTYSTTEEEPVECSIVSKAPKDSPRPDQSPDNRGIEEDVVVGASPGAAKGQFVGVANVFDGSQ